ncbi:MULTISPECIES: hypothetical protein [Alphaproteobacteria]|uniref:hypothetical protein n=1 Tax=Alphaproteobacteria TaxID=28211 RepID=UPI0032999841
MKKIADAIFAPDSSDGVVSNIIDRNGRATLRQVKNYWSDESVPRLAGVSETDIATLPSKELERKVAEFWGEEFIDRADRFVQQSHSEAISSPDTTGHVSGGGSSLLQKAMAIAACLLVTAFLGSIFLGEKSNDIAEVGPENTGVLDERTMLELRSIEEPLVAGIVPMVRSGVLPPYLTDLQVQDSAVLSSLASPMESAWLIDLGVGNERFQIVSITLGEEFSFPYEALEALGFDGNVRDAFSSRLASAEDIDPRRLQIGDRFLAVLQSRPNNPLPEFLSLSYFPQRQTASYAGQVPTCGTGSLTFSEPGLIRAALEMHANVTTRAVNNCASPLELTASNAVLHRGE